MGKDAPGEPRLADLTVAVFSYNRGEYLENCLHSLRRNLPWARVCVYDDDSDDPVTLRLLAGLDGPVKRSDKSELGRHGGLYRNMQRALDEAETGWILFLQEDMQIVRPVGLAEMNVVQALFDERPERAFVCPVFMKSVRARRHRRRMAAHDRLRAYVCPVGEPAGSVYSDVAIAHVGRLQAAGWRFAASEGDNAVAAQGLFADMPYLADPFAFYCPEVPVFRNRNRSQSLAARLAARVTGRDVKALVDMTSAQSAAFCRRALDAWPVAEAYLTPANPRVRRPFVYKDVKARWWLNALYRIEQAMRRGAGK